MENSKLRIGILGLKEHGTVLAEAMRALNLYELVAVADKDSELVAKAAKQLECNGFDDYRQFISSSEIDCLIVAAGLYSCEQYVKAGIEKKFNILKTRPLARNFEEAAEFVRLSEAENVSFAVLIPQRYSSGTVELKKSLEPVEQINLISSNCNYYTPEQPAWYNDPELAGGGVLLRDCYGVIDTIVSSFGLPEQVYALTSNTAADRQQRHVLCEDTAVVTMRFANDICANIVATKTKEAGTQTESMVCRGREKIVELCGENFSIKERSGEIIENREYKADEKTQIKHALEDFALHLLMPDENPLQCSAKSQLANMAVIEAAYLSGRTSMPEEPGKILSLAGIDSV